MKIAEMAVTLIDHMGSDLSVVNAARVSMHKQHDEMQEGDPRLINYLSEHNHFTPFCHAFASFRIKAPIFVARQLVKHQVGLAWNEVSRRYVDEEVEYYLPKYWRKRAENVKQGSSTEEVKPLFTRGICGYCGANYTPTSPNQKYCHVNCQANHYRERHPFSTKFIRWKASAKARGLEFSITESDLDWPRYCSYLGFELNYGSDNLADDVASLDRIDSSKGYVPGNVQVISTKANKLKNDASRDELITFARNVLSIHAGICAPDVGGVEQAYAIADDFYKSLLAQGVAPEQARMFLPQGAMTEWIWSGSLAAFARVCKLRLDPHAQEETREIAALIAEHMATLFPVSWKELMK